MKPGRGRASFLGYSFPMLHILASLVILAAPAMAQDTTWRVPFITTPGDVVERMLELAGTRADDLVVDLGSGDGRIVIAAARKYGARGLGIELDDRLVQASRENARTAGVAERVQFVQGDVLLADFSKASVVTVYLLPELIGQLQSKFMELRPGTRIVSHSFRMTGWRPDRSETMKVTKAHPGQGDESTLYLWIVPADVRGVWALGARRVRIDQDYQQIDVEGAADARLSGAEVSWRWPQGTFRGRVAGDRIAGELGGKPVLLVRR
jgi:SAM-dependent methyltransferase